ncbi:MAG: hypothetical protein LKI59_08130 [Bacteroidales bacterium]|jgi:hypothetical protein|nr:hypothetical protein [Bacteroidales bacterium]
MGDNFFEDFSQELIAAVSFLSDNEYYIGNEGDINGSGIRNWMMNALSMNNLLTESSAMKKRILFEDIPSSRKFLTPIMKAMKEGHKIKAKYKSFARDEVDEQANYFRTLPLQMSQKEEQRNE